jgi:cysteine desulfurase / selenocysteine lyase
MRKYVLKLRKKLIMNDFPILNRKISGKRLVYLDNAATSQKPTQVINAISDYYSNHNANVHRGIHTLGDESTELYEKGRSKVAEFIGARSPEEVIFTKNTTDGLNMVAFGWGMQNINEGDVILSVISEHHSSILPWQTVAESRGAEIAYLETDEEGLLPLSNVKDKLDERVKVIVIAHASNVLGTILPVKEICDIAKDRGIKVIVDGAQAVPHLPVNMQSLGCDFYAFSSHKMLGPMGLGVLWGKKELLKEMFPVRLGGGMVTDVYPTGYKLADLPQRFEAGTPDVASVVGLCAAIDYLEDLGMDRIRAHEVDLTEYAIKRLSEIEHLKIIGPKDPEKRTGLVSFTIKGIHDHDIAAVLNTEGVAVRSGAHCAINLHKSLQIPSTTRISFYMYNTREDVDILIKALNKAIEILK